MTASTSPRLQTLAPVGGVALSRIVRDQVDGKVTCLFDDMGEHTVKNIERPVHVFSARFPEEDGGDQDQKLDTSPRKLSVCVLPFANMSGDAEQEYFSDGISEDIITDLSKVSALSVVARNTAFTFKGKSVDVTQIARQLRVSHILEGSVRKSGGRVRITAQLIDGVAGDHVWAERYDRNLEDIFALQDEISEAIVKALKLKLLPEEKKAIEQRGTENAEAYSLYLMARQTYATGLEGDRPAQPDDHPAVPTRDRNRSELCARVGADGARADDSQVQPRRRRRRWARGGGNGRWRSMPIWPRPAR